MPDPATTDRKTSFHWTDLTHLGIIGVLGFFWHSWLKLFFLLYLIEFFRMIRQSKDAEEQGVDLKAYYRTLLYSQLNILQWPKLMLQLAGHLIIFMKYPRGLPSPVSYVNKTAYRLPFNEGWKTLNGGSTRENSHSWDILTQRYAYDFVIWDAAGKSHRGEGRKLADYYCWEKEIVAVADGYVVAVRNNVNDYAGVGDYSIDWKTRDFRGNFVVICHTPGEYSFSAHLMKGSIRVKKGDRVQSGEVIGLCGNSGHSTEPHLHFHLQDSASFWFSAGLPVRFHQFKVVQTESETFYSAAFVEKEQLIEPCHTG